jgi:hypothetical protein
VKIDLGQGRQRASAQLLLHDAQFFAGAMPAVSLKEMFHEGA